MICPHCRSQHDENWKVVSIANDANGKWRAAYSRCTACKKLAIKLVNALAEPAEDVMRIYPLVDVRPDIPSTVPPHIASDYKEACRVLPLSEKASAALSRRCLQTVLREIAKVRPGKLADEIEAVIRFKKLPSHISEDLHAVREIGNLAAHPTKNNDTGKIIDVEAHEAEWLINVLEDIFKWYFIDMPIREGRRQALADKLSEAGLRPQRKSQPAR